MWHFKLLYLCVLLPLSLLLLLIFTTCEDFIPANLPPNAQIEAPSFAWINSDVYLDGSRSSDPEGRYLFHSWIVHEQPDPMPPIDPIYSSTSLVARLHPTKLGDYVIRLTVEDDHSNIDTAHKKIVVVDSGTVIIAIAEPDPKTGSINTTVSVDGSNSFDIENRTITFDWHLIGKPSFSNAVINTIVEDEVSYKMDEPGSYFVELTVSAGTDSDKDTVETWVNPPSILSVLPSSGDIGDSIAISGFNFSGNISGNIVSFNSTSANVYYVSQDRVIHTTVPNGATTGYITVEIVETGEVAISSSEFEVTGQTSDFSLALSRDFISVEKGQSDTVTVFINKEGSFSDPVILSIEDGIVGQGSSSIDTTFSHNPVTGNSSVLTFTVGSNVTEAVYNLTVKGTSGSTTKNVDLNLNVTAPVNPWRFQFQPIQDLRGVYFTSVDYGVAVGQIGLIFKTTNGGGNWVQQNSNTGSALLAVHLVDNMTGYAAGTSNTIVYSSDGHSNWTNIPPPGPAHEIYRGLYFENVQRGWASGKGVYYTEDGGSNWTTQVALSSGREWWGISFGSTNNGAIVGYETSIGGLIQYTTNGGEDWLESVHPAGNTLLSDVEFVSPLVAFAAGYDGTILKTVDGGANWFSLTSNTSHDLQGLSFEDENNGLAAGLPILHTADGSTWSQEILFSGADYIYDVFLVNSEVGYAVGAPGIFRRN